MLYDLAVLQGLRTEVIDLSSFTHVTDIIEDEEGGLFFNVVLGGGKVGVSVMGEREWLVEQRVKVLKARAKFMKHFYKTMAKDTAKATHNPKADKKRKKHIKKELSLLKEIRDLLQKADR